VKPLPLESNASYVAAPETIRVKRHRLRRTAGYLLPDERVKVCGEIANQQEDTPSWPTTLRPCIAQLVVITF